MELFGIEAKEGSGRKVGALEEAHGGTLYLDEIADMPKETQGKILRVLVEQNFLRVGGTTRVHVDVRIISSSLTRSPQAASPRARFARICSTVSPLCRFAFPRVSERREDIAELIAYFMEQLSMTTGMPTRRDRRRRHGGSAIA